MYIKTVINAVFVSGALLAVPALSSAASPASVPVLEEQTVEAAIEGEVKRMGIKESTRRMTKTSESGESVDCFYEANKYRSECRDGKSSYR